jgi:hypothetical protein
VFQLDRVVPWGRSFDEYQRMFALTEDDLRRRILGCADGPASFNAELSRRGGDVISCDPLYRFEAREIEERIAATAEQVLSQTRQNADAFVWTGPIGSVEQLGDVRRAAMRAFLDDYDAGRAAGRYIDAELPRLPFGHSAFDLALCSHFLFLYSSQLGEAFHLDALHELSRVAADVRVYPLLTLGGERSPFVDGCARALRDDGCVVSIEPVAYEFQRGATHMLRVVRGF